MAGPDEPTARVRVTSSRRRAAPVAPRPVTTELEEETALGDVYLGGLMRAQLRLSLAVLALTVTGVAALPVALLLLPATSQATLLGVRVPWLVLGVAVYPTAWLLARWYTRQSERLEADFADVVQER